MTIRMRVTLYGIGVVAIALAVISVPLAAIIVGSVPQTQDQELAERAAAAVTTVARAAPAEFTPASPIAPLAPVDASTSNEIMVVVLDPAGSVLSSTGTVGGSTPLFPVELLERAGRDGHATATVASWGTSLRVHVEPWRRGDLGRSGFVVAAQPVRRQDTERAGLLAVVVLIDVIGILAASVGSFFVAGRALRPLRQLAGMADEIGRSTDLSQRLLLDPRRRWRLGRATDADAVGPRRRDDLGRLAESFNGMIARLQEAYGRMSEALAAQQRFTADASHELRTPLTTIRSNAGFLRAHPDAAPPDRAAALADIEAEGARMGRLVDDLLTLARASAGPLLARSTVDLGALAHEVCRQARGLHPAREFHCAGAPIAVSGDADALRRLLWILLENAVAHTEENGVIWVAVTRHDRAVTLQISDDGAGIPSGAEARLFDRFFRADPSRPTGGSGLGLSIALSIVREHGGTISASNNEGGGASFVAVIPLPSS
jgi:signal transduction histidine kinase